jgi:hypothetical protein
MAPSAGDTSVGDAGLTVNVEAVELPLPVVTLTLAVPGLDNSVAGTPAASCVALTNVVFSGPPFHFAVAPETKFVPLIVIVSAAAPCVAELGLKLETVGAATGAQFPLLTQPELSPLIPVA